MRKHKQAAMAFALALVLTFSMVPVASAWNNGGSSRTSEQQKTAADKADFSSPEAFTLNIKPVVKTSGAGIGTHDLILEQAIAQAIYAGADVSWIDVSTAQLATDDPDNVAFIRKTYPLGEDYRGYRLGGTGPRSVGNLYKLITEELAASQDTTANEQASKYLGWVAHMIGDMSNPFHVVPWNQTRVIKASRWHSLHVSFETDLDYYFENSVGRSPSKWSDLLVEKAAYLPTLAALDDTSTSQERRLQWFGGAYKKPPVLKTSARTAVINMTKRVRTNYGQAALKAWNKTWKNNYQSTTPQDRGSGTEWLLTNAPALLSESSTTLASLIVALSSDDPAKTAVGIDQIKKPGVKIKTNKLSKKMAKKYTSYTATATIKSKAGKALKEVPVELVWKRGSKVIKKTTGWTNSKGQVAYSYVPKRASKAVKITVEVSVATANYDKKVNASKTLKKLRSAKPGSLRS